MPIKCEEYNGVCVLSVDGDLTDENSAAVRRIADERAGPDQANQFVVDLQKASFIDSEGLESLLLLKRRSEAEQGRVKLAGTSLHCEKILEITRLAHRFECHVDLATALKTMR